MIPDIANREPYRYTENQSDQRALALYQTELPPQEWRGQDLNLRPLVPNTKNFDLTHRSIYKTLGWHYLRGLTPQRFHQSPENKQAKSG